MGDVTGFLKYRRSASCPPAGPGAAARLEGGLRALPGRGRLPPGGALHGLRDPVLPRGLPPRQPHPGVERPRLPRRLVGGHRASARHQQLSRVHRAAVPGSVRGLPACSGSTTTRSTIERIEYEIVERAWSEGWVGPVPGRCPTGKRVAVVGSGPAGLAAAQQLVRAGHQVVVFERAERPGGLLRYGIPEFKMEKAVLDRRLGQLGPRASSSAARCGGGVRPRGDPGRPGPRRHRGVGAGAGRRIRRRGAGRRRHAAAGPPGARSGAGRDPPGHGLPQALQPGPGGRTRLLARLGRGQARGHHRRW